jgi:phage major head subunit gpT-like protein
MAAITPSFTFDLESNMRTITSREYERLTRNLWWTRVGKRMSSQSKKERLSWLLDTAKIERPQGLKGGQIAFEDIVAVTMEIESLNANAGLKLKKEQLEDLDGNGIQLATHWSRQMGAYAAYWPQKCIADAIRTNPVGYDSKAFFATDHPLNPYNTGAGTYKNIFTSTSSGIYPGAVPIDTSVTVDTAIQNVAKAIAYTASIAMPNGLDPRFLRVGGIMVPPALVARAQQITNAKFIAQAAGSAAGSGDVEAVVRNFGFGQPIEAPELGSAFGGSDTTWYLLMEEITSDELGAFIYVDREPFSVVYHGPMTDAELARKREFQWTTEGRNVVSPGHPFLLFQCLAA